MGRRESANRPLPANFASIALEEWVNRRRMSEAKLPQNRDVWNALEFIASNLAMTFDVNNVVSAVCTSRRTLERQFLKVTGCTIRKAMTGIRMEAGAILLRETDISMILVATYVGISSAAQFSRQFKKTFGHKPTEYAKLFRGKKIVQNPLAETCVTSH